MTRIRFSQRKGITPVKVKIQRESIDDALRNKLWSAVTLGFFEKVNKLIVPSSNLEWVVKGLWINFFELPVDTLQHDWSTVARQFRTEYFPWPWHRVYDFLETLAQELQDGIKEEFICLVNTFLENEKSAYRFVGDEIGEFTSETEISAIESAIRNTQNLDPVQTHLREALGKLTDRTSPDYRNSIKESISAVEAMCRLITTDTRATLGDAIKKLKSLGVRLHPALEKAWSNLYGFTNDESGIRHALSEEPDTTFGDAKYMLVSCSAFVNYLLDLCREAGLTLGTSS